MNDILRQFYSEDASLKSLNEEDQVRRFKDWAEKANIPYELKFTEIASRTINVIYFCLGLLFICSLIMKPVSDFSGLLSPIIFALFVMVKRRTPQINSVEQDAAPNHCPQREL